MNRLEENFTVCPCKNLNDIIAAIENQAVRLLILEIGTNGKELKLLKDLYSRWPNLRIISIGSEQPRDHIIN